MSANWTRFAAAKNAVPRAQLGPLVVTYRTVRDRCVGLGITGFRLAMGSALGFPPSGRLVISEFVVDDGRAGPPFALMFNLNMLLHTSGGRSYEQKDLARLCREAGFGEPKFQKAGPVSTLVIATKA